MAMPEVLKVSEAAEKLRVSRATIYAKVARGELGAWKLGDDPNSPLRIPAPELERFLQPRRRPDVEAEIDQLRDQIRKAAP